MAHDLIIRGGVIADGLGGEPFAGDVAVDGGRISAVGRVVDRGTSEIDATGHIVSPGFVDLHTHLDAQVGWDPDLTPVSQHGVTTALMGNCGVTFAPCKPADRMTLAGIMETVEDIPTQAIMSGLPWTWESYGDYLDAVEGLKPGINLAGMVGHTPVRYYVMGERSFDQQATDDEVRQMADLVGQAMDRGAIGFSFNRYEPHKAPDGRSIPGTFADPSELIAIGKAVGARKGLVQAVGAHSDILKALADETGSRVLFSYGTGAESGNGSLAAARLDAMCEGRDLTAITQTKGTGYMFGLQTGMPFWGRTWKLLREMSFEDRLAAIRDDEMAARLAREGERMDHVPLHHVFYLGADEMPNLTADFSDHVGKLCQKTGERFVDLFLRLTRETNGKALFNWRMFSQNLDEVADLFKSDNIFPSLGDAGAHVTQISDADWATFVLGYWIRDRGAYSLGHGIRKLTAGPARVLGLKDRGVLAVGKRADINVFDFERVAPLHPTLVHDFPGGAPRFTQKARGYKATVVNGQINVLDGRHTGNRAGMVLRHAS